VTHAQADWLTSLGGTLPRLALGYRYEVQLGKMLDEKQVTGDHLRPYLRNVDVQWGRVNTSNLPQMDFDESDRQKFTLKAGDILVCEGGEVGRAAVWEGAAGLEEVYYQKALHRLRPLDVQGEYPRYMYWCLHAAAAESAYANGGKSTIAHLPADAFRRVRFPKPARGQQERIANFLDEQTARIDDLIAQKEAFKAAVQAYFAARLGTAVVEGISGGRLRSAESKGFEAVRADWALVPLKHLVAFSGGMTPSKDNDLFWVGEIPWVSPKDMKRFVLLDSEDHVSQSALDSTSLKLQPPNSILVVVRGMILAHTFPVALNAVEVTINQDMKAMQPKGRVSAQYLAWALRGLQPLMLSLTEESAHGTKVLRTDQWANQAIPVPCEDEQAEMVARFESWERQTSQLTSHLVQHIERLREYRSSLISAAVTGQMDLGSFSSQSELLAA
jgi:type I restriction enzyme S subunit